MATADSLDDEDCDISLLEPIYVTSEELVQLIVPSELQGLSFFCDASSELDCEADGKTWQKRSRLTIPCSTHRTGTMTTKPEPLRKGSIVAVEAYPCGMGSLFME